MYEALTNDGLTLQGELTPVDYHNADLAFAVTSKACVALGYAQAVSLYLLQQSSKGSKNRHFRNEVIVPHAQT